MCDEREPRSVRRSDSVRMFLSVDGKQTDVELRHELKEQMMDVTLREEPGKGT